MKRKIAPKKLYYFKGKWYSTQAQLKKVLGPERFPEPVYYKSKPYHTWEDLKQGAHKFNARAFEYNGVKYASTKEGKYAVKLDMMMNAVKPSEKVVKWERQVRYDLCVNGHKITRYILDFLVTYADGHTEFVDVKGVRTEEYKIKAALMLAVNGIKIKEV